MEWLTILIPFISTLFENCQDSSNASRAATIKKHPNIARSRLRKTLRKKGYRRKKLRKALDSAMNEIMAADASDIEEFLNELEEG
jgi:hypothetical protein|tara:strand:+ start:1977 stop:2231 length:255 start_codon:yes stop_codon:yes gene_type:complete